MKELSYWIALCVIVGVLLFFGPNAKISFPKKHVTLLVTVYFFNTQKDLVDVEMRSFEFNNLSELEAARKELVVLADDNTKVKTLVFF